MYSVRVFLRADISKKKKSQKEVEFSMKFPITNSFPEKEWTNSFWNSRGLTHSFPALLKDTYLQILSFMGEAWGERELLQ